jgi:hypothetical protein
LSNEERTNHQ